MAILPTAGPSSYSRVSPDLRYSLSADSATLASFLLCASAQVIFLPHSKRLENRMLHPFPACLRWSRHGIHRPLERFMNQPGQALSSAPRPPVCRHCANGGKAFAATSDEAAARGDRASCSLLSVLAELLWQRKGVY